MSTQLHTAVNDSATSWKVSPVGLSTVDGYPHPRWSTVASDYPLDWMVAGERVTASTPPVNGTWSHIGTGTGASDANVAGNVTLAPALHASTAQNDLILLKASIRNSGTGVPNAPGTYTRLPIYPAASNVQIFAKKAGAGEGAPTVSFTGGVANATILAQTFTFRSSIGFFSVSGLVVHKAAILSGSAVDIPYPDCPAPEDNCLVLVSGWRQQDWTSVATLAGMTELSELDDGAGDNAGQVLDYVIQTSAANITGSVFSVTGGVAGISRGAVAFLRVDTQTATVVRSVNDVVKSQVANEEIALFNPAIVG